MANVSSGSRSWTSRPNGSSFFGRAQRPASSQKDFSAGAKVEHFAPAAVRLPGVTTATAVPNEPVTPVRPMLARYELDQIELNLYRVVLLVGQAVVTTGSHVCRPQFLHLCEKHCPSTRSLSCGQRPAIRITLPLCRALFRHVFRRSRAPRRECFSLCCDQEARRFDRAFQFGERRIRITFRSAIFPKQSRGDHVDPSVRGLRREDGATSSSSGFRKSSSQSASG